MDEFGRSLDDLSDETAILAGAEDVERLHKEAAHHLLRLCADHNCRVDAAHCSALLEQAQRDFAAPGSYREIPKHKRRARQLVARILARHPANAQVFLYD
jgi:hypothetical protein